MPQKMLGDYRGNTPEDAGWLQRKYPRRCGVTTEEIPQKMLGAKEIPQMMLGAKEIPQKMLGAEEIPQKMLGEYRGNTPEDAGWLQRKYPRRYWVTTEEIPQMMLGDYRGNTPDDAGWLQRKCPKRCWVTTEVSVKRPTEHSLPQPPRPLWLPRAWSRPWWCRPWPSGPGPPSPWRCLPTHSPNKAVTNLVSK